MRALIVAFLISFAFAAAAETAHVDFETREGMRDALFGICSGLGFENSPRTDAMMTGLSAKCADESREWTNWADSATGGASRLEAVLRVCSLSSAISVGTNMGPGRLESPERSVCTFLPAKLSRSRLRFGHMLSEAYRKHKGLMLFTNEVFEQLSGLTLGEIRGMLVEAGFECSPNSRGIEVCSTAFQAIEYVKDKIQHSLFCTRLLFLTLEAEPLDPRDLFLNGRCVPT